MTTDQQHTPEPWHIARNEISETIFYCRGQRSETATTYTDKDGANARRIVACVNACAGISTEMLQKVSTGGIERSMQAMAAQRDELAAALRTLLDTQCKPDHPERIQACALARAVLAKVAA